jgi:hypothetical protein
LYVKIYVYFTYILDGAGKAFHSQWDPTKRQNVNREYSRVNSAYMLMYERDWVGDAEADLEDDQQTRLQAAAKLAEEAAAKKAAVEEMDEQAAAPQGGAVGSADGAEAARADGAESPTAAPPSAASAASSSAKAAEEATIVGPDVLSAEVTAQNLQFRHDQQVLNPAHFTFVRKLATANKPLPKRQKPTKTADAEDKAAKAGEPEDACGTLDGVGAGVRLSDAAARPRINTRQQPLEGDCCVEAHSRPPVPLS